MAAFIATLLNVQANSNPEVCHLRLEAKDEKDATAQAKKALVGELRGLGWTSYADTALWGKEQRVLVDVVSESDDIRRRGRGNQRGSEGQDAREERIRKAAKV